MSENLEVPAVALGSPERGETPYGTPNTSPRSRAHAYACPVSVEEVNCEGAAAVDGTSAGQSASDDCVDPDTVLTSQLTRLCGGEDLAKIFDCDISKFNDVLQNLFYKRVTAIECSGEYDAEAKAEMYRQWVELLFSVNKNMNNNEEEFNAQIQEKIKQLQSRSQCLNSSRDTLVSLLRRDISSLLSIIHNAYFNDCWDISTIKFETMTPTQVLGVPDQNVCNFHGHIECRHKRHSGSQHNKDQCDQESLTTTDSLQCGCYHKMQNNMKALAVEVAEKHDEICQLKKQLLCMEKEIHNAQAKIQLKDDVIKDLREELKSTNNHKSNLPLGRSRGGQDEVEIAPTTKTAETTYASFESIDEIEKLNQMERDKVDKFQNEVHELQRVLKTVDNCKGAEKNLSEIDKLFKINSNEKLNAYRKLHFFRNQLTQLQREPAEKFTPGTNLALEEWGYRSIPEFERDMQILNFVKQLIESQRKSFRNVQCLLDASQTQNLSLIKASSDDREFILRSKRLISEVAELLSKIHGTSISCHDVYSADNKRNILVDGIRAIYDAQIEESESLLCQLRLKEKEKCALQQEINHLNAQCSLYNANNTEVVTRSSTSTTTIPVYRGSILQQGHDRHKTNDNHQHNP